MTLPRLFLNHSIDFLSGHYLPKIEQCIAILNNEDVWWRPNDRTNSIGNLILHLSGNVRQWVVSGIGGGADTRKRHEEFERGEMIPSGELIATLRSAVSDACSVLQSLNVDDLGETKKIQNKEVTMMYAVYHVVEHFAMHTGQIIQITKERTGKDMAFYSFEKGKPTEAWRKNE